MRGVVDPLDDPLPAVAGVDGARARRPRRRRRRHAGRGVTAPHPAAPGRGGGRAGLRPDGRQRGRVLRLPGAATTPPTPHGYRHLTPNSPYLEDYDILQTTKEEDLLGAIRRGLRGAGLPVEFSKGEAGKGQHELNLTYQTAARDGRHQPRCSRTRSRRSPTLSGRSVTFMAKPHFDDAGCSCHIHSSLWADDGDAQRMAGDARSAPHERRVPLVPRRADGDGTGVLAAVRPQRQQLQALPARQLGADRRRLGRRQPHARLPGRRPRSAACASSHGSQAPTPTPTTPSPRRSPAACTASSERIEPPEPYRGNGYAADDLPRIPTTFPEAIELWRDSDRRQAMLRRRRPPPRAHPRRVRVVGVQRTVTDWERHRYFERI